MNCQECRELMIDYFDTDLSSFTKDGIEQHLQQCEFCRRQFDLTRLENQILKDTSDIPEIGPDFNSSVIHLIAAEASGIKAQHHFKRLPVFSKAAVAVALLLVCFYIPGIIPGRQSDHVLQRTGSLAKTNSSSAIAPQKILKAKIADKTKVTKSPDLNNKAVTKLPHNCAVTISPYNKSEPSRESYGNSQKTATSYNSAKEEPITGSMDSRTGVRSFKLGSVASGSASPETISLGNIPAGFILLKTEKTSDNQVDYSYETQDGLQSFLVKISLSEPAKQTAAVNDSLTQEASPMSSIALNNTAAPENESMRQTEFNGKTYQIIVSGSLSQAEIDHITNDISLSIKP